MQPRGSHKGGIMSAETLLIILFVGLVAGWLAGQIVQGTGFGLVADIAIGMVGALSAASADSPPRLPERPMVVAGF